MTAFARPEDRDRALAAGFEGHLAKPIDPARLVQMLADLASSPADTGPGAVPSAHRREVVSS